MRFSTSLRQPTRRRLERLGSADIVIGIPCFNNDNTIAHVVQTIENGLNLHYPEHRCVVFMADGGSVDDSREEGEELDRSPWIERIISIYRGIPGKGSAVRAIFEAANMLGAKATLLFDSDLRSITTDWIKSMVDAILNDGVDFVAPYYTRYKYDGTITNNIVYNLTRAFCIREGVTREDDVLPERLMSTPLPGGSAEGMVHDQETLELMKDAYYDFRGWDRVTGIPTEDKLRELDLAYLIPDLWG